MTGSIASIFFIDGVILAIIALFAIIGYKRGFIKTAVMLGGNIVVVIIAVLFSNIFANFFFDSFMYDKIHKDVKSVVTTVETGDFANNLEMLPDYLKDALESSGLGTIDEIAKDLEEKYEAGVGSAAELITTNVAKPIVTPLVGLVFSLVVILIGFIAVAFLSGFVSSIADKIVIVGSLNKILGTVLGLLAGVMAVFLFSIVVIVLTRSGSISNSWMEESLILDFFNSINPVINTLS